MNPCSKEFTFRNSKEREIISSGLLTFHNIKIQFLSRNAIQIQATDKNTLEKAKNKI
jgi:F0F1-type ATP synthase epsilon subunit